MSNVFSRFQARNKRNIVNNRTVNTSFITSGENSTVLVNKENNSINAAVVNKQEQEVAYVYTELKDKLTDASEFVKETAAKVADKIVDVYKDVGIYDDDETYLGLHMISQYSLIIFV